MHPEGEGDIACAQAGRKNVEEEAAIHRGPGRGAGLLDAKALKRKTV